MTELAAPEPAEAHVGSDAPPAPPPASVGVEGAAGDPGATLGLAYHQRMLIVGTTRSGKSVFTEYLVSEGLAGLVLVIDPKGLQTNYGPRMTESEIEAWFDRPDRRIARWVPTLGDDPKEYDAIYAMAHRHRGPLTVVTDELYGPGIAQLAPRNLKLYLTQGGGRLHGHIGLTQRPANICMEARTEWDHLVVYAPAPDPADLRKIAGGTGVDLGRLDAQLRALGKWECLWIDRASGDWNLCPPVPVTAGRIV